MKKMLISMLAMAAMVSCSSESDPIDEVNPTGDNKVEVKFNSSIAGIETKAAITGTTFTGNEEIGIFGVQHATISTPIWLETGNFIQNEKGTVQADKSIDMTNAYYYPTADYVSFYAYYPYENTPTTAAGSAPTIPVTVKTTPTDQIDYMWAVLPNIQRMATSQTLPFQHALSLLDIKVIKAADVTETDLKVNKIIFTANKSTATMKITDGTITDAASDVPVNCTTGNTDLEKTINTTSDNAMASFVLLPGTTITDFKITVGTKVYDVNVSTAGTLTKSERTTFTVTLSAAGVSLGTSISDWSGNGTGSGTI